MNEEPLVRPTFLLSLLLVGWGGFWMLLWFLTLGEAGGEGQLLKDWHCVWSTGQQVLLGNTTGLYPGGSESYCVEGFFWLYPPYGLYPASALAMLPLWPAYGTLVVLISGCMWLSLHWIREVQPNTDLGTILMSLCLGSAALNSVVVTGQFSAFWLLALVLAWKMLRKEHWVAAGVSLSVLGLKPNWVVFFLAWLLITSRFRVFGVVAVCGVLFIGASLPLGLDLWFEFLNIVQVGNHPGEVDTELEYPPEKLITLHAALRSLPFLTGQWLLGAWLLSLVPGVMAWGYVCKNTTVLMRQIGVTTLLMLCANPYVQFYDALILIFPVAVWLFNREHYPRWCNTLIPVCIGLFWSFQWAAIYLFHLPFSPFGFLILIWLVAEAIALWKQPERR